jgi:hypothetical protein
MPNLRADAFCCQSFHKKIDVGLAGARRRNSPSTRANPPGRRPMFKWAATKQSRTHDTGRRGATNPVAPDLAASPISPSPRPFSREENLPNTAQNLVEISDSKTCDIHPSACGSRRKFSAHAPVRAVVIWWCTHVTCTSACDLHPYCARDMHVTCTCMTAETKGGIRISIEQPSPAS